MPSNYTRPGARVVQPSEANYSLNKKTLRGLSPEDIYEIKTAKERIALVLKSKKSPHYHAIRIELEKKLDAVLRGRIPKLSGSTIDVLGQIGTQSLRDEVLKMVELERPLAGIPQFRGKASDGDPIDFFKKHYAKYIKKGSEVIFTIDLLNIDKPLLTAMRNSVATAEMPLGNRAARTDAIAEGRFKDSDDSRHAAEVALETRRRRKRSESKHAEVA